MKSRLTQKDLARKLGVSQALVSRALSGTSGQINASPATVERIRKAAAALRYSPNAAALSLKGAPTRTLSVVVKSFDDPFFGHLIGELQRLAAEKQYALLLAGWNCGEAGVADEMILRKYQPDGLIVCGSDYQPQAARFFLAAGKPVVQIGLGAFTPGLYQVAVDEAQGLGDLVSYLAGEGHGRFGFVGDGSVSHRRREKILMSILARRGLVVADRAVVTVAPGVPGGVMTAARRWSRAGRATAPTALIAADDAMAQTVLRALYEQGIRVPEAMSLAGMDDIPAARTMIPALTTVGQPVAELVGRAFALVTGGKAGPGRETDGRFVIAPRLVVRESCAPPWGGAVRC